MSDIFISALCVTAGRVPQLEAAIACFLDQTHQKKELVILNTCPKQELELGSGFDNVRIINLRERPSSLGAARNMAASLADGTHLIGWDDDDLYAPWYLQSFASRFEEGVDWLWLDKNFYSEGGRIKKVGHGMANTFAFTKAAWEKAGKYAEMSVGEDRDFVGRLTRTCPGKQISIPVEDTGYLYCWGQGTYHVSGMGDDKPGHTNAWERARLDLERRIRSGTAKTGRIVLAPAIKVKPEDKIREFLKASAAVTSRPSVCLVMLGRIGDIVNALPIAKRIAELHAPPAMMVSREFASVLDGVSYVVPHAVDLPYGDLNRAMDLARKTYPSVVRCQIWGKGHNQERKTESFNVESWREAGMLDLFYSKTMPPVFDRRDLAREEAIWKKLSDGRPMLLLKIRGAISVPFSGSDKLEAAIRKRFEPEYQIVELGPVVVERVYDLLGLLDRARALVSIDTMTLHLAAASDIPVVALTGDDPWVNTIPRCNCLARFRYAEATAHPEKVIQAVDRVLTK